VTNLAITAADFVSGHPSVKLSILMPAYNENQTIPQAVASVLDQEYPCPIELVLVDDGSKVPARDQLEDIPDPRLTIHRHEVNLGKGAALRQAAALATGTHIVPFDADMEYDPADLIAMLRPVLAGRCDVVYGTRLFGVNTRFQSYRHGLSNKVLTLAANVTFNACIGDLHTCLKLMPLDLFRSFPLREVGFGLDTEITARILRTGMRPFEVPVSYHSRSKAQGKKITWRDGFACLMILVRIRRTPLRSIATAEGPPSGSDIGYPRPRRAPESVPNRLRQSGRRAGVL
jgi:glycosyltransferase involved in cell wall biosynthesis